jgi:hypothetical protein
MGGTRLGLVRRRGQLQLDPIEEVVVCLGPAGRQK